MEQDDPSSMVMTMHTPDKHAYYCKLPNEVKPRYDISSDSYNGPSALELIQVYWVTSEHNEATMNSQSKQEQAAPKRTYGCSYKMESYWTYELCHGVHIKQYHEESVMGKLVRQNEFHLGYYHKSQENQETVEIVPPDPHNPSTWAIPVPTESTSDTSNDQTNNKEQSTTPSTPSAPPSITLDSVQYPYLQINYTEGSLCDLTSKPRETHVLYICHETGRGEMYEIVEQESCQYRAIVLVKQLCSHPDYVPRRYQINNIECQAVDPKVTPHKPPGLVEFEATRNAGLQLDRLASTLGEYPMASGEKVTVEATKEEGTNRIIIRFKVPPTESNDDDDRDDEDTNQISSDSNSKASTISNAFHHDKAANLETSGTNREKQTLLRRFINGEHCLTGGSGWWQYEFCFESTASQFHKNEDGSKQIILLGKWNERAHLEWLKKNPADRPSNPAEKRTVITYFYSNGDRCDLTGKSREVKVRLVCVEKSNNPGVSSSSALAISLQEPQKCQYILQIEGSMLCPVVRSVNEDGILDKSQLQ